MTPIPKRVSVSDFGPNAFGLICWRAAAIIPEGAATGLAGRMDTDTDFQLFTKLTFVERASAGRSEA